MNINIRKKFKINKQLKILDKFQVDLQKDMDYLQKSSKENDLIIEKISKLEEKMTLDQLKCSFPHIEKNKQSNQNIKHKTKANNIQEKNFTIFRNTKVKKHNSVQGNKIRKKNILKIEDIRIQMKYKNKLECTYKQEQSYPQDSKNSQNVAQKGLNQSDSNCQDEYLCQAQNNKSIKNSFNSSQIALEQSKSHKNNSFNVSKSIENYQKQKRNKKQLKEQGFSKKNQIEEIIHEEKQNQDDHKESIYSNSDNNLQSQQQQKTSCIVQNQFEKEQLGEEVKNFCWDGNLNQLNQLLLKNYDTIYSLGLIDLKNTDDDGNTIYEKCILFDNYNNIQKYCYNKLKKKYNTQNYFQYIKKGNLEAVYCCLKLGVKVNFKQRQPDGDEVNGFLQACFYGHIKIVRMFCEIFKIDINQQNQSKETGFILACRKKRTEVIKYLLMLNVDLSIRDSNLKDGYQYLDESERVDIYQFIEVNDLQCIPPS